MHDMNRKANGLFQPLLCQDAGLELKSDMLLRRNRMAFRSSLAISTSAAIILFFSISVSFWTFAILILHLYRRSKTVFITILSENLQGPWQKPVRSSQNYIDRDRNFIVESLKSTARKNNPLLSYLPACTMRYPTM